MIAQEEFQELDLQIGYNQVKSFDISQLKGRAFLAVNNPGSYWLHFLDGAGTIWEWVWPTTFGWVMPLPLNRPGQLRVSTADLPVGYSADSTNQTANASVSVLSNVPRLSLGVQQLVSTKAAAVSALSVYNVQANPYAAKGDGVTDDSGAIQTAINAANAAGGGIVYLPPGTYKILTGLTIKANVWLMGAGMLASQINAANGGIAITATTIDHVRITNLTINEVAGTGTVGISLTNCNVATIEDVKVKNYAPAGTGDGIDLLLNCNETTIRECTFENNKSWDINIGGTSNATRIIECNFNKQAQTGSSVLVGSAIASTLIQGCNFEGNGNGNIGVSCNGANTVFIVGNYFEQWVGACVAANSGVAKSLVILNNSMQATSAAGACIILNSAGPNDNVTCLYNDFPTLGNASMTTIGIIPGTTTRFVALGNRSGGAGTTIINGVTGNDSITLGTGNVGFYGTTAIAKPTVTGAKAGNAALTSLMSQLAALGLVTDSTT